MVMDKMILEFITMDISIWIQPAMVRGIKLKVVICSVTLE